MSSTATITPKGGTHLVEMIRLLKGNKDWPGLGHNSVYAMDGKDYLVFHAYEMADKGLQKLKISALQWDKNGWPQVNEKDWLGYQSLLLKD